MPLPMEDRAGHQLQARPISIRPAIPIRAVAHTRHAFDARASEEKLTGC